MPQPRPADIQIPDVPPPPGVPGVPSPVAGTPVTTLPGPITREQAAFLRTRRDALSNQLESVQGRREEVADQLRSDKTLPEERPGLQDRLRVLDERLMKIEQEIAANSEQLANAPSRNQEFVGVVPRGARQGNGFNGNLITIFSFVLLMPFAIQLSRRWFSPNRGPSRNELAERAAAQDRMDKMESAIDAVALEVERIGEGQRFLTQAMVGGSLGNGAAGFEGVKVREPEAVDLR
ncbi:MAG: hypothetical protein V4813_08080 [Gemmatimonadota bacterium]